MIRRAPKVEESPQDGAKIALRTSSAEEFHYLPLAMLPENQRAFEELARRQAHDEEDLRTAHRITQEEADQDQAANPLKIRFRALKMIQKNKDEDIEW